MINEIKSRQNEKIKDLVKLINESRKNKHPSFFVVEGNHLLDMALESKLVTKVFSTRALKLPDNIEQYLVTNEIMEKISSQKNSQGVVVVCKGLTQKPISSRRVLYLDDVSDPGNVGTLLRTALAFGYYDVILSKNSCSIFNEKVLQASQGAIFKLNIVEGDKNLLMSLKDYEIIATEIKGSTSLDKVVSKDKLVLVLGNEAHGVKEEILKISSNRVRIGIENIESLNVAVAGAIAMYALR